MHTCMCLYLKRVFVFLNGFKIFKKNMKNTAAKARRNKFNSETSFCSLQWRRHEAQAIRATRPAAAHLDGLTVRWVYRENHCPGLLVHISSIMRFPASSDDGCHPLQHFGSHTRYSDVFLCCCQRVRSIQMCCTLPHMLAILQPKARTVNCKYVQQHSSDDPKLWQSMIRFNAWQRHLDLKGSRPLRIS